MRTQILRVIAVLWITFPWTKAMAQSSSIVAQSSFIFESPYPHGIVLDADGIPLFGTKYVAALYGGATIDYLQIAKNGAGSSPAMHPVSFDLVPGYFFGPPVVVESTRCGGQAWLQVRAWDTRVAPTYEAAAELNIGGYGESNIYLADGGNVCIINPDLPGTLHGLESFSLRPVVPEPSTWVLAALGGVALWLGARRTRQR